MVLGALQDLPGGQWQEPGWLVCLWRVQELGEEAWTPTSSLAVPLQMSPALQWMNLQQEWAGLDGDILGVPPSCWLIFNTALVSSHLTVLKVL